MPKYQAITNGRPYAIDPEDLTTLNAYAPAPDRLHLLVDDRSHHAELLAVDLTSKTVRLKLNGRAYAVTLRDEVDQLVDRLGFSSVTTVKSKNAIAPMPGLVLEILVSAGQEVSAGTPLIILEAMKMENVLKAEGDGTVRTVEVSQGEAVEKKQLLLTIE